MQTQINKLDFSGQNIYVGVDTHKKNWKVSIVHEELFLKTFVQDPDPDVLYNYLFTNFPGANYHSAYEASYCGFWIHYRLKQLGVNSIVVNPGDIPTTHKEKVQKEDKRDSRKIVKCLRAGDLVPIYVPRIKTLQDRTLIRTRYTVAKELRRFKNRVKSFLLFYGIKFPDEFYKSTSHWSKRFIVWLEALPFEGDTAKYSLSILIQQVKNLRTILLDITRQIRKLSQTVDYKDKVRLLKSVPGIGLITAMLILVELEDIARFKSLDRLCAYIGFVPSTNSTGDNEVTGDITPRKHKVLRTAIVESAWVAIKNDPALLMSFTELKQKMDENNAIIRIAKKLLSRIRYVIKNEKEYVKAVVK